MDVDERYPRWLRLVHLLVAVATVTALLTGQFADDYRRASHTGFDVHLIAGICAACVVGLRWALGVLGPMPASLASWERPLLDPRDWWRRVLKAVAGGAALEAPHSGLGGLVQFLMLVCVGAMAATGLGLAFLVEPGQRAAGLARALKEVHEAVQPAILGLLVLHVSAAAYHQFVRGHALLTGMFGFGRGKRPAQRAPGRQQVDQAEAEKSEAAQRKGRG